MIRSMMSKFGRGDGPRGLGEVPTSVEPAVLAVTHGQVIDQVVAGNGSYFVRFADGYLCAYPPAGSGQPNCEQGSPNDPPLTPAQVYPPPSSGALQSCGTHGGVFTETNPDPYSFHIVCMDGYTCDGGAEQQQVCTQQATPVFPKGQPSCGDYQFSPGKGLPCECMPGTTYTPNFGGFTCELDHTPGSPGEPTTHPIFQVVPGGTGGTTITGVVVKPGHVPGTNDTGDGTPGTGGTAKSTTTTVAPSLLRRAIPWILGGVGLVVVGVGGKVVYTKLTK